MKANTFSKRSGDLGESSFNLGGTDRVSQPEIDLTFEWELADADCAPGTSVEVDMLHGQLVAMGL